MKQPEQQHLFESAPYDRYLLLSKEELITLARQYEKVITVINKDNDRLRLLHDETRQLNLLVEEQLITIKNKLFGKSSERSKRNPSPPSSKGDRKKKIQLPSARYPKAPLIERHITLDELPSCKCCGSEMSDSGMSEESEYLTKVPAQYYVVVQMRHKYACRKCHGEMVTAPAQPRITPGGAYSDAMMIDVALSKYCDLIPIERQANMAAREGLKGLPPQSLIEGTHQLATFLRPAYEQLKTEMLSAKVWHADETPHRMLEGDKKSNWFLWGFSTKMTSYFECHDTRSGDVASGLLSQSACEYLISDVYSGYGKAVKRTNELRDREKINPILHVYCNAHARRYFKEAAEKNPTASDFYIKKYRRIYRLEHLAQKYPTHCLRIRERMRKYFEKIRDKCQREILGYSSKSKLGKAMGYFLNNYEGFTRFISHAKLRIDNNPAERLLRGPVIGRKTWYGTHSKRGAETVAILFSLIESCKLNQINPREYFKNLVQDLHQGKKAYTPKEYIELLKKS